MRCTSCPIAHEMKLVYIGAAMMNVPARALYLSLQVLFAPCCLEAQLLSTKIRLSDWGLKSLSEVQFGQLNVSTEKGRSRLIVQFLKTEIPVRRNYVFRVDTCTSQENNEEEGGNRAVQKATWIWNTTQLLADTSERARMVEFLAAEGFDRVFLQLPIPKETRGGTFSIDSPSLRALIAAFSSRGISVDALDGDPHWVLPQNHSHAARAIELVKRYNGNARCAERFSGLHFDIEPHLVPGFGGTRRPWILEQFLLLIKNLSQQALAEGLSIGIDVPCWLDAPDEFTGEIDSVTLDGLRRPVLEHLLPLVREVCVMSYRTNATGQNGILEIVRGEMGLAQRLGCKVFVSVETGELADERIFWFRGRSHRELPQETGDSHFVVALAERDSAELVLVPPWELGRHIHALERQRGEKVDFVWWRVGHSVDIPSKHQTFAPLGSSILSESVDRVLQEFGECSAFAGIAFHHAASYQAVVRGRLQQR